jgi:O-antigen ligase
MRISRGTLISGLIAAVVLAFAYDLATAQSLTRGIIAFAQKGKASDTLSVEDVIASRQGIIEQTWRNFLESPLIGIGFEVSKSDYFRENATLFNAPIEKGFLPAAVLEETGIIGTFFFVIFLAALIGHMVKTLNVPGLAMILTFLAVNCGESMFFSLGGHGAYGWLMMAAGMILGDRCVVRQSLHVPRPLSMPQLGTPLRQLQPHFGN